MKLIIAGSRNFNDYVYLQGYMATAIPPWHKITEVVSGGASGADSLGEQWAKLNGIPVKVFNAEWERLGKRAGPIRNAEMSVYGEGLIAFWDGESKGTKHMIDLAARKGMWIAVVRTDIPWSKEFHSYIHQGKTIKTPKLNNVTYYNEKRYDDVCF